MDMNAEIKLSRREREIMDIVYARGRATAATIRGAMHEAPSSAAVRKLLQILETKGHLKHGKEGREHVYQPVKAKVGAARRAMQGLLDTFFGGSLSEAIASHLTGNAGKLQEDELKEIARMIRAAREQSNASNDA
jgi:BlaI family transcriptional regulator, penicillinase repressor